MGTKVIESTQIDNRSYWVGEISKLSGDFGADSNKVEQEMSQEVSERGRETTIGHLRLCGAIPEKYAHDSSEEKLYSKYTDIVIGKAYEAVGLQSFILTERSDAADVECNAPGHNYSFVADAKAFRLSRTAKNQKDFKVQAIDNWKRGRRYAMVVCPIYQLPSRTSQIYQQAASRSVAIFSYTHLAVLVRYAEICTDEQPIELLHEIFRTVEALNPSKDSTAYWQAVNRTMLRFDSSLSSMWAEEKTASVESVALAKEEALNYLASERERIKKLSKEEAIKEIIKSNKIETRIEAVASVSNNAILDRE